MGQPIMTYRHTHAHIDTAAVSSSDTQYERGSARKKSPRGLKIEQIALKTDVFFLKVQAERIQTFFFFFLKIIYEGRQMK